MVARFVDADNGAKPENTLTMRSVGKKRKDMSDVLPPFVFFFFFSDHVFDLIAVPFILIAAKSRRRRRQRFFPFISAMAPPF